MDEDIELKSRIRRQFGRKIIEENNSRKKINKEIARLKIQYGDDFFLPFDLDAIKQKEFSKEYFQKLVSYFQSGACSEAFFLHIFEVKRKLRKRKIIKICVSFSIIFCILFVLFRFNFYKNLEKSRYKNTITTETIIEENLTNNQNEKGKIQEPKNGIEKLDELDQEVPIDNVNNYEEIVQLEQFNVEE